MGMISVRLNTNENEDHQTPEGERPGYPLNTTKKATRDGNTIRNILPSHDKREDSANGDGPSKGQEA